MPHRDLLAALLPPVSYDARAHLDLSLAMEGRELDRVQADGAAVLGALPPVALAAMAAGLGARLRPARPLRRRRATFTGAHCPAGRGLSGARRHFPLVAQTLCRLAGYDVEILEFTRIRGRRSSAGDALTNGGWVFAFLVVASGDVSRTFRSGQSVAGEALRTWGDPILECIINWRKPAHTIGLISYLEDNPRA